MSDGHLAQFTCKVRDKKLGIKYAESQVYVIGRGGAGGGARAGRGQLPGEPHEGDAESEPLALAVCSSEFLHVVSSVFGEAQR